MKTNKTTRVLCVVAMLGVASGAMAQEDKKKGKNLDREMTLEREYDPSVQDANKVNTLPAIKEPTVKKRTIDYASFTVPTDPQKQISVLPSGSVMTEMEYNRRRGYLNLAAGMHLNINGDFGYHILNTEKDRLNVFLSHRSTNGNVKYIQTDEKVKAKLNDNWGGLNYSHTFDKLIFNMGAKYGYSGYNYYGLPLVVNTPDTDYATDPQMANRETNQVNQTIAANIGVESKEGAPFGYLVDLDYINFSHKYGLGAMADGPKENTFDLRFDFFAPFGGNQQVGLAGQAIYFNYSLPQAKQDEIYQRYVCHFENHAEATLNPYYKVAGENWNLKLGAKVMFVTGENSKFMASPDIAADVEVADKTVLYMNAGGKLYSNSMYEMAQINRYIDPTREIMPSRNWLDTRLGIKSGIASGFWFDIFGGAKITSDDYFFVAKSPFMEKEFGNLVYVWDDLNTTQLYGGVALKYKYQQWLDLNLKAVYNHWTAKHSQDTDGVENRDLPYAYGKPKVEINAGITIRPLEQLAIDLNYYLATDRYTLTPAYESLKMDNINELNLRASYTINKTFGVNLQVNNLLCQEYDLYYGYPVQGFNLMGGVNINF